MLKTTMYMRRLYLALENPVLIVGIKIQLIAQMFMLTYEFM